MFLWTKAYPTISGHQLEGLTRFHEPIEQAVAESLEQYATLKEVETRLFGAILFASPDPIYVLDLKGRLIYANKATADLFALKPAFDHQKTCGIITTGSGKTMPDHFDPAVLQAFKNIAPMFAEIFAPLQ